MKIIESIIWGNRGGFRRFFWMYRMLFLAGVVFLISIYQTWKPTAMTVRLAIGVIAVLCAFIFHLTHQCTRPCGSWNTEVVTENDGSQTLICNDCGYPWSTKNPEPEKER